MNRLDTCPERVVDDLENFRKSVVQSHNLEFHLVADLELVRRKNQNISLRDEWHRYFGFLVDSSATRVEDPSNVVFTAETRLQQSEKNETIIVPLQAVESSFLFLTALGPDNFMHEDIPVLMVIQTCCFKTKVQLTNWIGIRYCLNI